MLVRRLFLPALACLSVACTTGALPPADPAWAGDIDAGTLAVISDGDFVAGSYRDGRLAPEERKLRDVLTVLTRHSGGLSRRELEVSNSVSAAPEVLALSRDGATAFVVEQLAPRAAGQTQVRELAPGRRLVAIDLRGDALRIADSVSLEAFPEALALSPDGRTLAIVSNTAEASWLQFVAVSGTRLGPVQRHRLDQLGVQGPTPSAPRGGVTATNVAWHPAGAALAVNLNTANQIVFFKAGRDPGGTVQVERWGDAVTVGPDPFVGRFTPDGRHFLSADWGRNFAATTLEGRLPARPSAVSVIRLAGLDDAPARHERVAGAATDLSSEGLAVSPDGRLVATVNMRGTALDPGSPRHDEQASVSLLSFDPQTGGIRKLQDLAFEGVLPEGASFDLGGRHLLVTVFEYRTGRGAGVEVFRVDASGARPRLLPLGRLSMPHGAHHIDVAR